MRPHAGVLDVLPAAESGPYGYAIDANVTGTVTAANASNPRRDIVYVELVDPAEGTGGTTPGVTPKYLAGTAAATPVAPATPARSMLLAEINVPAAGGGNPTVTWRAPVAVAAGGIVPVRTTAERDAVTYGTADAPVFVSLLGDLYRGVGSSFAPIGTGRTAVAAFTATGIGTGQILNAQVPGFVVPGKQAHAVRVQVTGWLFNGANAGNYTLFLRQNDAVVAETQIPYGNGYGDRRTVAFEFTATVQPGAHKFDVVSASGSASAGYDTAKTCQLTVTDLGPVS
ncbi:hypothetical protein [Cellulomonas shaoxiangyii]|uniref:Uncharacterized protein n=1 Tax=Cellulomonas shaoxiangyii TaxID=2566013 RepID=A0A4P7SH01_9CELL|nr:hypothetical protein [Cellulomonas shaoxiangyii]QCB93292.1 hypothetical protein E5225_06750 [Cellulomonas shaoxiangyii]TGY82489.1 hypothetical protein E5226_13200 [Cellulomonas shaoxiangyii]